MKKKFTKILTIVIGLIISILSLNILGDLSSADNYIEATDAQKSDFITKVNKIQSGKQMNYEVVDKLINYDEDKDGNRCSSKSSFYLIYDCSDEKQPLAYCECFFNSVYYVKEKENASRATKEVNAEMEFSAYIDVNNKEAYIIAKKNITDEPEWRFKGTIKGVSSFREVFVPSAFNLATILASLTDDKYKVSTDGNSIKSYKKEEFGDGSVARDIITGNDIVIKASRTEVNTISLEEDGQYRAQTYIISANRYNYADGYNFTEFNSTKKGISLPSDLSAYSTVIKSEDFYKGLFN